MLKKFKNYELLQYKLSSTINKNFELLLAKNDSQYESIFATICSTMASTVLTQIAGEYIDKTGCKIYIILFYLLYFISFFLIGYLVCVALFKLISAFIKLIKSHEEVEEITLKQKNVIINNFDNIACDCILIAFEFINDFNSNLNNSKNLRTYYYYETFYYLSKAINYTQLICDEEYIKLPNSDKGIDLFRLENIISLIDEICCFILKNKDNITITDNLKKSFIFQIDKAHANINILRSKYESILQKNY